MLHAHPAHRSRQMRWVLPAGVLLFVAVLAAMGLLYTVGNQDIGTEFFRAHKTISRTGELLQRGVILSVVFLAVLVVAIGFWALGVTHRIVRPVHTLHLVLDELVTGNLGVRLELHRRDEFQEVSAALNQLIDEFSETLGKVHDQVDRMEVLAAEVAAEARDQSAEARLHALARELNQTMEFFRREPSLVIRGDV